MTRQKRELIRRIDEIEAFIAADDALGCGFAPPDYYRGLEEEAWALEEQLARLRGYRDANAMMMDTRGLTGEKSSGIMN